MDQTTLINYLNSHKGVYLEGADFGFNNSTSSLYAMFGCTYDGDGNASGNVSTVTGQTGSIAQGKNYDYLYQEGPDSYVDYIGANGGTIFFRSQDTYGRAVNYSGPGNNYRSIHSTFIFGALRNGTYNKQQLMQSYMTYLLSYTGAEEHAEETVSGLAVRPNPGRIINVSFFAARPAGVRAELYNVSGQKVRTLLDQPVAAGSHTLTFDGKDDRGQRLSDGAYLLRLEQGDYSIARTIVLIK